MTKPCCIEEGIFLINDIVVTCLKKVYFSFFIGSINYCSFSAEGFYINDIRQTPLKLASNFNFHIKADSEFTDFKISASLRGYLFRPAKKC